MLKQIKQSFLSGLVFSGTVIVSLVGFTAYTNLPTQNTGDTLNSTIWNNLVTTINDIGNRTDGIYNNGGNIGIGINNPNSKLQISNTTTDITQNITPSNSSLYIRGSEIGYGLAIGNSNASSRLGKRFIQSIVNDNSTNPNDILLNPKGGNIGIGTISPFSSLSMGNLYDGKYNYLQLDSETIGGAPPAADCNSQWHRGRLLYDATGRKLYICSGTVWKYIALN